MTPPDGERITIPNHFRILLEDEKCLYYVEEGNLDLFVIEVASFASHLETFAKESCIFTADKLEGRQTFFCKVGPGELIFPFPFSLTSSIHVLGRANGLTYLRKIEITRFLEELKTERSGFEKELLRWIYRFSPFFVPYREEYPTMVIEAAQKLITKNDDAIVNQSELVWVKTAKGAYKVLGHAEMQIRAKDDFFYPLSQDMWLKSEGTSNCTRRTKKMLTTARNIGMAYLFFISMLLLFFTKIKPR